MPRYIVTMTFRGVANLEVEADTPRVAGALAADRLEAIVNTLRGYGDPIRYIKVVDVDTSAPSGGIVELPPTTEANQ